ncbi:hypothetical protein EVAR_103012_1 [Eumeta japonica]|uniref:Uncharacterized protein n=1 Tax=Eumeta variegata TaxID=151549 RepID=A0A4C1WB81_EUMVA|nr:hypothetical protein EVAR_103012_1 [Eumeta japonica]
MPLARARGLSAVHHSRLNATRGRSAVNAHRSGALGEYCICTVRARLPADALTSAADAIVIKTAHISQDDGG